MVRLNYFSGVVMKGLRDEQGFVSMVEMESYFEAIGMRVTYCHVNKLLPVGVPKYHQIKVYKGELLFGAFRFDSYEEMLKDMRVIFRAIYIDECEQKPKPSYDDIRGVPACSRVCLAINHRVNMSNGTGWHVQTTVYQKGLIGVGIDRVGFFLFKGDDCIRTLTSPVSLKYVAQKLGISDSDAEGMQEYYRWFFEVDS